MEIYTKIVFVFTNIVVVASLTFGLVVCALLARDHFMTKALEREPDLDERRIGPADRRQRQLPARHWPRRI